MKKLISLLLVAMMAVSVLPIGAYANPNAPEGVEKTNLALGRLATSNAGVQYGALKNLTDGVTTGYNFAWLKSVSTEPHTYVQLDLDMPCLLSEIVVYARDHASDNYIGKIAVEGANKADFSDAVVLGLEDNEATAKNQKYEFPVETEQKFRYIRVRRRASGLLIPAEIEVYGYWAEPEMELVSAQYGDLKLENSGGIPKGLDYIDLNFTTGIDKDLADNAQISLKVNGNDIGFEYEAMGDGLVDGTLRIKLKDGLTVGDALAVSVDGLTDVFSQTANVSLSFTAEDTEAATGTVEASIPDMALENVVVEGTVYSSQNIGISGRTVELMLTYPDGTEALEPVASSVSGTGGKFTLTYNFDEADEGGSYIFKVKGEYSPITDGMEYVYLDSNTESLILTELGDTKSLTSDSPDEKGVREVFDTYSTLLGIMPVEDRKNSDGEAMLADCDSFYSHFIGKKYSGKTELKTAYENYYILEIVNQATMESQIEAVLKDEANRKVLELPEDRMSLLTEWHGLISDVLALDAYDEPADIGKAVAPLVEKHLALACGKTDAEIKLNDLDLYNGEAAEVKLEFASEQTEVSKLVFELTSDDEAVLENVSAELIIKGEYDLKETNDAVLFTVIPVRTMDISGVVGSFIITLPEVSAEYAVSVKGTVTYNTALDDEDITVTTNIIKKDIKLTMHKSSGGNGSTGGKKTYGSMGSVYGGSTGGTTVVIPVTPVTPVTPNTNRYFTDLASSVWAEEAVNALTEKGIISKNEDGMFYPERTLTREEFVKLIVEALDLYDTEAKAEFTDISADAWYAPYVASAYKAGFITGKGDGSFGLGESITREDMAVMLMRACKFNETASSQFADDSEIADYAKTAVYTLKSLGIINGTSETHFSPKANSTRAMAAKVIYEMLKEVA